MTFDRRAILHAPDADFTPADWAAVVRETGGRCYYCGLLAGQLTKDHMIPLARGGRHTRSNVVPSCIQCNSAKRRKTPEEYADYIRVRMDWTAGMCYCYLPTHVVASLLGVPNARVDELRLSGELGPWHPVPGSSGVASMAHVILGGDVAALFYRCTVSPFHRRYRHLLFPRPAVAGKQEAS